MKVWHKYITGLHSGRDLNHHLMNSKQEFVQPLHTMPLWTNTVSARFLRSRKCDYTQYHDRVNDDWQSLLLQAISQCQRDQ